MKMTALLDHVIKDIRAWTNDIILNSPDRWCRIIPERCVEELVKSAHTVQETIDYTSNPELLAELHIPSKLLNATRDFANTIRNEIRYGAGFVLIDKLPVDSYSLNNNLIMYWILSKLIGDPVKLRGHILTNVRQVQQKTGQFAAFSTNNEETDFHNDMSFHDPVPSIIGLFCIQQAKTGGENQLISAYTIHNKLLLEYRYLLPFLYELFYIDRRGHYEGLERLGRIPIFQWDLNQLIMRYQVYRIRWGFELAGEYLPKEKAVALEAITTLMKLPELKFTHRLEKGQILMANNRSVLHYRNTFEDDPDPSRWRHLFRIMLAYPDSEKR